MCNTRKLSKIGIISRHACTNILDALKNAGMYNYQSELVTLVQRRKRKQRSQRTKTATNFILKGSTNYTGPFIINFKSKL